MRKAGYYAVIPSIVLFDDRLTNNEKILFAHISTLVNMNSVCELNNAYFANALNTSERSIQRMILNIENTGYIQREYKYQQGTKVVSKRLIKVVTNLSLRGDTGVVGGGDTDGGVINTLTESIKYIVEYLNEKSGKSYKATSKKTKDLIKARFNDGFRGDDFKRVIDTKTSQWLGDSKMEIYLRPETLFGTKFESYLNENQIVESNKKLSQRDIELMAIKQGVIR